MQLFKENYLALYLSITKNYSTDQSLRAMGVTRNHYSSQVELIDNQELEGSGKDIAYEVAEGGC